jgi:integrase/recombinase XerD
MDGRTISWFPLDQVQRLEDAILGQLDETRRARRRDALACSLGLSGLRSGEVSQIVMGDLAVPLRRLRVRTLKGGPHRALDLDETLVRELMGWRGVTQSRLSFAKLGPEDLLLPNNRGGMVRRERFNWMAQDLFDRLLGVGHGLTFHSLRHTFAMRAYAESKDLFLVQRQLGHSSVKTTEIYAQSLAKLPESCKVVLSRNRLAERIRVVCFEDSRAEGPESRAGG